MSFDDTGDCALRLRCRAPACPLQDVPSWASSPSSSGVIRAWPVLLAVPKASAEQLPLVDQGYQASRPEDIKSSFQKCGRESLVSPSFPCRPRKFRLLCTGFYFSCGDCRRCCNGVLLILSHVNFFFDIWYIGLWKELVFGDIKTPGTDQRYIRIDDLLPSRVLIPLSEPTCTLFGSSAAHVMCLAALFTK